MNKFKKLAKAGLITFAIFLGIGLVITILLVMQQKKSIKEYENAAKITSNEMLQEAMDSNVQNAFIYGDLEALDPVSYPKIQGEYVYIKKVKETYNISKTNSTVNGKTKTKVKKQWRKNFSEYMCSDKIRILGMELNSSAIDFSSLEYIDRFFEGPNGAGRQRTTYTGCKANCTGTIYLNLQTNASTGKMTFYNNKTIDETIKSLESNALLYIFWVVWGVLTLVCVVGVCVIGNKCMPE